MTALEGQTTAVADALDTSKKPAGPQAASRLIAYGHWWWALPALVLMGTTIYLSTATGAFYAFTDWTGAGPFNFVGLANFTRIFQTPELLGALTFDDTLRANVIAGQRRRLADFGDARVVRDLTALLHTLS